MPRSERNQKPADDGQLITARELSRRSGVSLTMLYNLSKRGMIPRPVDGEFYENPRWDLDDPALADWLRRMEASGYGRRK